MPVDYKLRSLKRLFGESSLLRGKTSGKPSRVKQSSRGATAASPPPEQSEQDDDATRTDADRNKPDRVEAEMTASSMLPVEDRSRSGGSSGRGSGGLGRAFFHEQPPRSINGKAISGHMFSVYLYEKQKMKVFYGAMRDHRFKRYVDQARSKRLDTDAELLKLLEMRLDTFLYRTGFVKSPMQSRHWIHHGKIRVNEFDIEQKSHQLRPGDIVSVQRSFLARAFETQYETGQFRKSLGLNESWIHNSDFIIPWIEIDRYNLTAMLIRYPTIEELRRLKNSMMLPYLNNVQFNPHYAMRSYR